jgi:hypothetical protein
MHRHGTWSTVHPNFSTRAGEVMEPDEDRMMGFVAETLEEAGLSGLCLDGRIDLAVDRLRRQYPEMDAAAALALVRTVVDKNGQGGS